MNEKEMNEKIEKLKSEIEKLNEKVFPVKNARTRGDPVVELN